MVALESYYHPSNIGHHTVCLSVHLAVGLSAMSLCLSVCLFNPLVVPSVEEVATLPEDSHVSVHLSSQAVSNSAHYSTHNVYLSCTRERYRKPTWEPAVPSESCLTEHDIDRFVQSVLPAMRLAVFSRIGMLETATAIQCLALVRPEWVLPELMERWVWSGVWSV